MIIKYLEGGSTGIPPLVSYLPVILANANTTASSESGSKDSDKEDLTDKDLIDLIKNNLDSLPNDTDAIILSLRSFYISKSYGLIDSSNVATKYLTILGQIQRAKVNKEQYEEVFNIVKENGGMIEYAMTSTGQLVCVNDNNDFLLLTYEELKNNPEYTPLTNSLLLELRAYNPELAYNYNITSLVRNGIGIEKVSEMIRNNLSNLGTSENSSEGYANTKKTEVLSGLQTFIEALKKSGNYDATVLSLYKATLLTKSLAEQALQALEYIYMTLPINARTLLKTRTKNGTDEEVYSLISKLVSSKLSSTSQFELSLEESPDKPSNKKGDSPDSKRKLNFITEFLAGRSSHESDFKLDLGNGIEMFATGSGYEAILDLKSKLPITNTSIYGMLNLSAIRGITSMDKGVYFGNQRIKIDDLKYIQFDDSLGALRINLPVDSTGKPRFDLLEEYFKAETKYDLLGAQTIEERRRIFSLVPKLAELLLPNGEYNPDKFAPFMLVSGITTDGLIHIDKDNNAKKGFIKEIDSTPKLIEDLKNSLSYKVNGDTIYPDIDEFGWAERFILGAFDGWDDVFKGVLYIPINMNKSAAELYANYDLPLDQSLELEQEYLQRDLDDYVKINPLGLIPE